MKNDIAVEKRFVILGRVSTERAQKIFENAKKDVNWEEVEESRQEFDAGGGVLLSEVLADGRGSSKQVRARSAR